MNIWKISLKNIKSKPLYTFLSILMLSLSIALLLVIQQLKTSCQHQMDNNLGGIDLVIGAKGSPLQLVLASVLHLDNPTGNISYKEAKKIAKNPMIKKAVPISYGDNYKGYKIVGTTHDFASFYKAELDKGKHFKTSMEVVLGNTVATQLNLNIGDTFLSSHGLIENEIDVHDDELKVVGILKPTKTVIDRLIITSLESVWDAHHHEEDHNEHREEDSKHEEEHHHDHDHENEAHKDEHKKHEHHHENHDEDKEVTSLLIQFRNPTALLTLPRNINKRTNMQAALPKYELDRLYEYVGVGFKTITWIAYIILLISGLIIFISLYKMVKERAFDLALLRTYGASNFQLVKMVFYEGIIIVLLAFVLGFVLLKAGLYFMLTFVNNKQNIIQDLPLEALLQIGGLVFVMVIVAIALAIYPIVKMNISTILSNEK